MTVEFANLAPNDTDDKADSISIVNKMRSRLFQTPNSAESGTGKKKILSVLLLLMPLFLIGFVAWYVASIFPLKSIPSASLETAPQSIESGAISQSKPEVIVPKPPPSPQPVYWSQFSSDLLHLEREQTVLTTALSELLPTRIPVESPNQQPLVSSVDSQFSPTETAPTVNGIEKLPTTSDLAVQIEAVPNSWSAFGNQLIQLEQQRQQFLQSSKH